MEDLILKTCRGEKTDEEIDFVCGFYKDDINKLQLQAQLPLFQDSQKTEEKEINIPNVMKNLSHLSLPQQQAFSQVFVSYSKVVASNASNKRLF